MRRGLFIVLCLCSAMTGQAQTIYVSGGAILPVASETVRDFFKMGLGAEIGIGQQITEDVDILIGAHYGRLALDEDAILADSRVNADISGGDATLWGGQLMARIRFDGAIGTYLLGGLGYSRFEIDDIRVGVGVFSGDVSGAGNDALTTMAGFGLLFPTGGPTDLFVEGRAVYLLDDGEDEFFVPIRAGITFTAGQ